MDILLIEDNDATRRLLEDVLNCKNYTLLSTNNAEEGIDIAIKERPKIILMDIQLPGMNGLQANTELRKNEHLKNTKIIGMSAHALPNEIDQFQKARFDCFLTKPFSYQKLLAAIEDFL